VQARDPREARSAVGDATRVALIWDGVDLALGSSYAQAFADLSDLSTYIAGEQANARGAEAMGMLPGRGPGFVTVEQGDGTFGMFERARRGELAVLSIFGANPVRNAGDSAVAEALAKTQFLVVSDLFMTETASKATLVLPAKGAFEKNGTTTNLTGDLLPVNASLQAPEFVRSDFELLLGLADQLEVGVPSLDEIDRLVIASVAAAPADFTFGDGRYVSAAQRGESQGEVPILSGGGTWLHDPWLTGMRA
jgi:anaerobic selenocysteine-containing dehydrogenase